MATPLVRKRYAELIRKRAEERETEKAVQTSAAAALSGKTVLFSKKVTKAGKLYAGITEKNIAEALNEQLKYHVSEDDIQMDEHIKSAGTHQVMVRISNQNVPVNVKVDAEKA